MRAFKATVERRGKLMKLRLGKLPLPLSHRGDKRAFFVTEVLAL